MHHELSELASSCCASGHRRLAEAMAGCVSTCCGHLQRHCEVVVVVTLWARMAVVRGEVRSPRGENKLPRPWGAIHVSLSSLCYTGAHQLCHFVIIIVVLCCLAKPLLLLPCHRRSCTSHIALLSPSPCHPHGQW